MESQVNTYPLPSYRGLKHKHRRRVLEGAVVIIGRSTGLPAKAGAGPAAARLDSAGVAWRRGMGPGLPAEGADFRGLEGIWVGIELQSHDSRGSCQG